MLPNTLQKGSGREGLATGGRAKKELAGSEVADGGMGLEMFPRANLNLPSSDVRTNLCPITPKSGGGGRGRGLCGGHRAVFRDNVH